MTGGFFETDDNNRDRIGDSPALFSEYKQFVRDSYLSNIRMFIRDDLPFTIELTSGEFFAAWREKTPVKDVLERPITLGGTLSFCYSDGNHTYDGVKQDFLNCDAALEPGGFILFDDSTVDIFGVRRLMPEVLASGRYKLVAQNPNHLFQKLRA